MNVPAILRTAISSLGVNRLRAALALLGIVIGVASVVTLMSIGRGIQAEITSSIESLGTNLLLVSFGGSPFRDVSGESSFRIARPLTLADAEALSDPDLTPSVKAVAAQMRTGGQIAARGNRASVEILGVTSDYLQVRDLSMLSGIFIASTHVANKDEVVVLGSALAESLFGFRDPVGQPVRINARRFTVIGVLQREGQSQDGSFYGFLDWFDRQVMVPVTTAYYRLDSDRRSGQGVVVEQIYVQAASSDVVDAAFNEIRTVLRLRHRITEDDDFTITSQREAIEALAGAVDAFVVFLGAIAGVSLLVGGIGIMNIMLVSVVERTREIGIRKAMGAKRRDILLQFVFEAVLLTVSGGVLGILLGMGVSALVSGVSLGEGATLQTVVSGDIATLAVAVSAAVGLFFGIYPASRASRLRPIEALRTE